MTNNTDKRKSIEDKKEQTYLLIRNNTLHCICIAFALHLHCKCSVFAVFSFKRDNMIKLIFKFKAISKDNEKIFNRAGRFFLSDKYKQFEELIQYSILQQYRGVPLTGNLHFVLIANFKNKKHCDCLNLSKGIADACQGLLYKNDNQIKEGRIIVNEGMDEDSFCVEVRARK